LVIGPSPRYQQALPRLILLEEKRGDPLLPERQLLPGPAIVDKKLGSISAKTRTPYVSLYKSICPARSHCITVTPDGQPVMHDGGHFTLAGSRLIGRPIADKIRSMRQSAGR
jgi:hypothetical protein